MHLVRCLVRSGVIVGLGKKRKKKYKKEIKSIMANIRWSVVKIIFCDIKCLPSLR